MRSGQTPAPSVSGPAIYTSRLRKVYGATVALDELTMTVPRGEIFGFLGPNGAGKTTAVKLLVGLTQPSAGEAWVLGAPAGDRATRRRIGYLPELFRYQDWLSAREVLQLHCRLVGMPHAEHTDEIASALRTVGLTARADDRVATFSKGMQQRLGLAVSLLGQPDVILLDEPTSALDPVGRHDVREIMHMLKQRGATVFLNSHLLSEVELVCDRVAIVNAGRVIALGSLEEVLGELQRVHLRVKGLSETDYALCARFGPWRREGDWLTVEGISDDFVPDLVAELTGRGGRVYAVEPRRQTLEERFLELVERGADADIDHRPADVTGAE